MGRGAQDQTRQLTDQQLANINALNQQFLGQQQQVGNLLLPQLQSILNNPGLSAADKAAVTSQSQGAVASAFDSLQQAAANRAARTRNSAGFADLDRVPAAVCCPARSFRPFRSGQQSSRARPRHSRRATERSRQFFATERIFLVAWVDSRRHAWCIAWCIPVGRCERSPC